MESFVLLVHVILCIGIIFLVLLQQGKGADAGVAFGGGSNSLFGAAGANNFVTRLTTGMAVAFFLTSIILVRGYSGIGIGASAPGRLDGSALAPEMAKQAEVVRAAQEKAKEVKNSEAVSTANVPAKSEASKNLEDGKSPVENAPEAGSTTGAVVKDLKVSNGSEGTEAVVVPQNIPTQAKSDQTTNGAVAPTN